MASYKVVWRTSAERDFRKLPREVIVNLVELATTLSIDPFRHGAVKLAGADTYGGFVPAITASSIPWQAAP
jgi:mRNA interferase RelE/StbE